MGPRGKSCGVLGDVDRIDRLGSTAPWSRICTADPSSSASHPGELHSRMRTSHPMRTDSGH